MNQPKQDTNSLLGALSLGQSRSYTPKDLKNFPPTATSAGTFAPASNAFGFHLLSAAGQRQSRRWSV